MNVWSSFGYDDIQDIQLRLFLDILLMMIYHAVTNPHQSGGSILIQLPPMTIKSLLSTFWPIAARSRALRVTIDAKSQEINIHRFWGQFIYNSLPLRRRRASEQKQAAASDNPSVRKFQNNNDGQCKCLYVSFSIVACNGYMQCVQFKVYYARERIKS